MNVPKLRFKEFCEDVTHKNSFKSFLIKDIANIQVGRDLREESFSEKQTSEHLYPVYSNTVENRGLYGFYNFEEYDGNSLTIVGRGVGLGTAFARNSGFGAIGRLLVVSPKNNEFDVRYFAEYVNYKLKIYNESGGIPQLPGSAFGMYSITLPHIAEQAKIANFLTAVDEKITQLTQKYDLLAQYKKGVMQKIFSQELRFKDNDVREFPEWEEAIFDELFYVANNKKTQIKSSKYLEHGKTPIVDQGQKLIVGYTNNPEVYVDVPVIIFGDHTRILKWIDFAFASGADGTQVLKSTNKLNLKFGYYALSNIELPNLGYSRHMKELKEQFFMIPASIDEQTKIANFLTAIDDKITQTQAELDAVKQYKQGLLQQMFI